MAKEELAPRSDKEGSDPVSELPEAGEPLEGIREIPGNRSAPRQQLPVLPDPRLHRGEKIGIELFQDPAGIVYPFPDEVPLKGFLVGTGEAQKGQDASQSGQGKQEDHLEADGDESPVSPGQ